MNTLLNSGTALWILVGRPLATRLCLEDGGEGLWSQAGRPGPADLENAHQPGRLRSRQNGCRCKQGAGSCYPAWALLARPPSPPWASENLASLGICSLSVRHANRASRPRVENSMTTLTRAEPGARTTGRSPESPHALSNYYRQNRNSAVRQEKEIGGVSIREMGKSKP